MMLGIAKSERERIVSVAKSWIGTRYNPGEIKKHGGCDCGSLLAGVYSEAGIISLPEIPKYDAALPWAKRGGDELYLTMLSRYAHAIPEEEALAGDIAHYLIGRGWSHAAIIVHWPDEIIHATMHRGVVTTHGKSGRFAGRPMRFWSVF
jgi:cell wall-associated NlpC family hydrolase